ncbi:MAG: ACT domain-containing protein [Acidobacteriota bacterium]
MRLLALPGGYAVCRLDPAAALPAWTAMATGDALWSVTRTAAELSIVCAEERVPAVTRAERGFRAFVVAGPLDFSAIGILAALTRPLAEAGISLIAISTFDTDYLLVRAGDLERAVAAWRAAGHQVEG